MRGMIMQKETMEKIKEIEFTGQIYCQLDFEY